MLLLAVSLSACGALRPVPEGARAIWAFDVETYLGRRYAGYGLTLEACSRWRQHEISYQDATQASNPERFPFYRTIVLSRCYAAALADGGYGWAVEAEGTWGAVMPSEGLCEAMRETLAPGRPPEALTACVPVTLTPR
jgi:hypothetical protein